MIFGTVISHVFQILLSLLNKIGLNKNQFEAIFVIIPIYFNDGYKLLISSRTSVICGFNSIKPLIICWLSNRVILSESMVIYFISYNVIALLLEDLPNNTIVFKTFEDDIDQENKYYLNECYYSY